MGTFLWLAQRFSSLIILSYILIILISYFVKPYDLDAQVWFTDIRSIQMKIFTSLFLIAIIVVGLNLLSGVFINNMYQQKPDGAAATVEVTIRILQPVVTFALLGWAIYSTFYGWEGAAAGH